MLNGAIAAQGRVGLMLNARKENLSDVIGVLPALNSADGLAAQRSGVGGGEHHPGRGPGARGDSAAESGGATGIVEYPLNKVVM